MRKLIFGVFVIVALVCTAAADTVAPAARPTTPSYVSQVLGALPGDSESSGHGVNDAGSVVGVSFSASNSRGTAFYWDRPTGLLYQLTTSGANGVAYAIAGGPEATAYAVGYELLPSENPLLRKAVIWIAPPTSGPITLDGEGSEALGVNDNGIAVGFLLDIAVIWSPNETNVYARTDIALLPNHASARALDINNNGIVVGEGHDLDGVGRAFLRLLDGSVLELPPIQGDTHSGAAAVSDVFADGLVYVAGWTRSANGVQRGVRWTVNIDTGVVVDQTVLRLESATGVNGAGGVTGTSSQGATLWQGGSYIKLAPPKGGHDAASSGLARTASSPTYVVGDAQIGRVRQAVVWDVN